MPKLFWCKVFDHDWELSRTRFGDKDSRTHECQRCGKTITEQDGENMERPSWREVWKSR